MAREGSGSTSRLLGFGLLAGAAALGLVGLAWLVVVLTGGGLSGGGFTCGLALILALVLPLALSGIYMLSRAKSEARQAQHLAQGRAILDADALLRDQLTQELSLVRNRLESEASRAEAAHPQVAIALEAAGRRLADLAAQLKGRSPDEMALLDSLANGGRDPLALRRYDTLVVERARQLSKQVSLVAEHGSESATGQAEDISLAIDELEAAIRQRQDLLLRARGPGTTALDLLAVDPMVEEIARISRLRLGDIVVYDERSYLVQGKLTYLSGESTWRAFLLRDGEGERWLHSSPGGSDLALFEPAQPPAVPPPEELEMLGERFALESSLSASVSVETESGSSDGFAEIWRFVSPGKRILWVERWPDHIRARVGQRIRVHDVRVFSRAP